MIEKRSGHWVLTYYLALTFMLSTYSSNQTCSILIFIPLHISYLAQKCQSTLPYCTLVVITSSVRSVKHKTYKKMRMWVDDQRNIERPNASHLTSLLKPNHWKPSQKGILRTKNLVPKRDMTRNSVCICLNINEFKRVCVCTPLSFACYRISIKKITKIKTLKTLDEVRHFHKFSWFKILRMKKNCHI